MPIESRRVVITGAAGRIGRAIAPQLSTAWSLVLTDRSADAGIEALDVTDLGACRTAFAGADAVVHLAADPDPEANWERLLPANVVGAYAVAQAAMDAGVRRLVLASSLHAMSAVEQPNQVRAEDQPRPGNLYGATKAWAEAIGAWVTATSDTTAVALRIGWFLDHRPDVEHEDPLQLAAWLSARDAAELVRAAVEAESTDFVVANGISANRHQRADLSTTTARLGYRPRDDAWGED